MTGASRTLTFKALQAGDLIGVIAPAGPAKPEQPALVEQLLARHGFRARLYPSCFQREGYLAGPDALRLADVHAAFADTDVHTVICLRGGYGCGRLLGSIDTALLQRHAKLLVGYSDVTALHALLGTLGIASMHAPMLSSDLIHAGHEEDADALFALLRQGLRAGQVMRPLLMASPWKVVDSVVNSAMDSMHGVAEGRMVGGNLSLVASMLGTPWAFDCAGAVLFLEDVNEEPYRVDRLLGQLHHSGDLQCAAGFILGSFTDMAPAAEIGAILAHYLAPLRKPVIAGWPAGHGTPNRALPIGVRVRMDAAAGSITLLEDFIGPR